jgi:hypothetical protein
MAGLQQQTQVHAFNARGAGVVARVELRQVGDGLGDLLGRKLLGQLDDLVLPKTKKNVNKNTKIN